MHFKSRQSTIRYRSVKRKSASKMRIILENLHVNLIITIIVINNITTETSSGRSFWNQSKQTDYTEVKPAACNSGPNSLDNRLSSRNSSLKKATKQHVLVVLLLFIQAAAQAIKNKLPRSLYQQQQHNSRSSRHNNSCLKKFDLIVQQLQQ